MTRTPISQRSRVSATIWFAGTLFVAAPAAFGAPGGAPDAQERPDADLAAVGRVLARRPEKDTRDEAEVARELAALGTGAIPELLALANGRATRWLERETADAPDTAWIVPRDRVEAVARAALARLPAAAVLAEVRAARLESDADRVAALLVLGELRSAHALAAVLDVLTGFEPLALRSRALRGAAERALVETLRDPEAWSRLEGPLSRLRPDLVPLVADAAAAADRPEAVRVLAGLLGDNPTRDEDLLGSLAGVVARHAWRTPDVVGDVGDFLNDERPELRAAAARTLGRLGGAIEDTAALHALIDALEDPEPNVRRAAEAALRELTGARVPEGAEAWRAWLLDEEGWWVRERERLVAAATGGETAAVLAAVRELASHRALHGEVGPVLTHVLGGGDPACVTAACSAVATIGHAGAVPALGALLFEPNPRVRAAAWEALRALTGEDLPLDEMAWDARIRG